MRHFYSGLLQLSFSIKAAAMIGQRLRVDPSFRKAIHLPWFAEKTTGPAVLRTFTLVMCHGLRSRVFSAAAIARRLSEGFAGIAVFLYFSVPRDFPSLCHALCIRNYMTVAGTFRTTTTPKSKSAVKVVVPRFLRPEQIGHKVDDFFLFTSFSSF